MKDSKQKLIREFREKFVTNNSEVIGGKQIMWQSPEAIESFLLSSLSTLERQVREEQRGLTDIDILVATSEALEEPQWKQAIKLRDLLLASLPQQTECREEEQDLFCQVGCVMRDVCIHCQKKGTNE